MLEITNLLHSYPKKHGISIEWTAEELFNKYGIEVSYSSLQAYLSINHSTPFPAHLIVPFCQIHNNDFSVLDYIEAQAKRTAIAITCDRTKVDYKSVAKLAKEAGEAISVLASAILDGIITPDEKQSCIDELLDLQRIVTGLLIQLNK